MILLVGTPRVFTEQGYLVERQSVKKRVEKTSMCQKALGRKKGRKVILIVCLKTSHMVERHIHAYFIFDNMTRFEANDRIG